MSDFYSSKKSPSDRAADIAQRVCGALMAGAGICSLVAASMGPWQATVCLSILGATALISGVVLWCLK